MAKVKRVDYLLDNPKKFMSKDLYKRYRSFFYQFMRDNARLSDSDLTVFKCCHELGVDDVSKPCSGCYFSDGNSSVFFDFELFNCYNRLEKFLDEVIEI